MCSIAAPNTASGVRALVAVADGMGGHQGGEVASNLAIEGVVEHLGKNSDVDLLGSERSETLAGIIHQIHEHVRSRSNTPETMGMGTTLSIAVIGDENVLIGHVGDDGQALAKAREIAERIAANGPLAVKAILKSVRDTFALPESEAFPKEMAIGIPIFSSKDAQEGPRAFLEKRKPKFVGK